MRIYNVANSKKITAGIIGTMMLFIVLFSAFFIAAEADHDCSGHDCPICVCIEQCEHTLHQIGSGAIAVAAVSVPVFCLLLLPFRVYEPAADTLITRKTRLND